MWRHYMTIKWTKDKLEQELERDCIADREINNAIQSIPITDIMKNVERLRKIRQKKFPMYTQEFFAKKVGISRGTYQNYLHGEEDALKVKTLLKMVDVLRCDIADVVKKGGEA